MTTENKHLAKIAKNQPFKFFDIIVSSSELKKLIIYRIEKLNLDHLQVCEANNVSYNSFKKYLNNDKSLSTASLRQEHILNIAKSLGVNIRVQLVYNDISDVDRDFFTKEIEDGEE